MRAKRFSSHRRKRGINPDGGRGKLVGYLWGWGVNLLDEIWICLNNLIRIHCKPLTDVGEDTASQVDHEGIR
jgi:hypothetical protein